MHKVMKRKLPLSCKSFLMYYRSQFRYFCMSIAFKKRIFMRNLTWPKDFSIQKWLLLGICSWPVFLKFTLLQRYGSLALMKPIFQTYWGVTDHIKPLFPLLSSIFDISNKLCPFGLILTSFFSIFFDNFSLKYISNTSCLLITCQG